MKHRKPIKSKYILLILVVICILMVMFALLGKKSSSFNRIFGNVITPIEKVFTKIGNAFENSFSFLKDKDDLIAENQRLTIKNEELSAQIASLQLEISNLEEYKSLYELDKTYSDYNKVAANVIAKDSGNWFSSFTIDKGLDDGLGEGMNVISGYGLVGKIVAVGNDWAQVRTIIDSSSHVSAMGANTGDYGILSGSLELAENGCALLEEFYDSDDNSKIGEMIVTSNVSDVYWPGIVIGYLSEIEVDENNLTKTGTVKLAADFEHLKHVLVITDIKEATQN